MYYIYIILVQCKIQIINKKEGIGKSKRISKFILFIKINIYIKKQKLFTTIKVNLVEEIYIIRTLLIIET